MEGGGKRVCVPISLPNNKVATYAVLELVGFTSGKFNEEPPSSHEEQQRKRKKAAPVEEDILVRNATMFVQADASSFRDLVQRLTGAAEDDARKMPVTKAALQGRPGGAISSRRKVSCISPVRNNTVKSPDFSPKSPLGTTTDVFGLPSPSSSSASSACSQQPVPVTPELLPLFPVHSPLLMR